MRNNVESLNKLEVAVKATIEEALKAPEPKSATSALDIHSLGLEAMKERAASRDSIETGERSMAKTIKAFNALTGRDLTESEGWLLMVCLKAARSVGGAVRVDDYVDGAAYFSLYGECEVKARA